MSIKLKLQINFKQQIYYNNQNKKTFNKNGKKTADIIDIIDKKIGQTAYEKPRAIFTEQKKDMKETGVGVVNGTVNRTLFRYKSAFWYYKRLVMSRLQ